MRFTGVHRRIMGDQKVRRGRGHNVLKNRFMALSLLAMIFLRCAATAMVTIGVDWGEEFVEVSIGYPGHKPDILLNDTGSRKFANAVCLDGRTRLFDQKAAAHLVKNPKRALHKSAHIIGLTSTYIGNEAITPMSMDDVSVTMAKSGISFDKDYMPYDFGSDTTGQMYLKVTQDKMVKPEEVSGHFFSYIKDIVISKLISAKAHKPGESDPAIVAVISIPCNYTQKQRKAIAFAAESSGISVVQLVHGITAASVMRAFEQAPGVKRTLFYDLGSSGANVGVVEIVVPDPKNNKANAVKETQIQVLSCVHEPGIGGRFHDVALAEHLRAIFEKKNAMNLMPEHPQALQKLLKAANKAKIALTISSSTNVAIEGLTKNKDFETEVITRDTFNDAIKQSIERLQRPVEMALLRAGGIKMEELDGVELIGGAWRVPAVQEKLAEIMKPQSLGFHLNAEESIAMGSGYLAVAHNPFFKMKAATIVDNSAHHYSITISSIDQDHHDAVEKKTSLFKPESKLQGIKSLVFKIKLDFTVKLKENEDIIAEYKVTGIEEELKKEGNQHKIAKVTVMIKPDERGIIKITKATAILEPEEMEEISEPVEEHTVDPPVNGSSDAETNENKEDKEPEVRTPININMTMVTDDPYSKEFLDMSKNAIQELRQRDKDVTKRAEKKNALESLIYKYKSASRQEQFKAACDEETYVSLQDVLTKYEEWFDEESYDANLEAFEERITQLEGMAHPIHSRWMDNEARPSLIASTDKQMDKLEKTVDNLLQTRPYLTEKTVFIDNWNDVKTWWEGAKKEQESLLPHQEPAFTAEVVKLKLSIGREAIAALEKVPEPKANDKEPSKDEAQPEHDKATKEEEAQPEKGKEAKEDDVALESEQKPQQPEPLDADDGKTEEITEPKVDDAIEHNKEEAEAEAAAEARPDEL